MSGQKQKEKETVSISDFAPLPHIRRRGHRRGRGYIMLLCLCLYTSSCGFFPFSLRTALAYTIRMYTPFVTHHEFPNSNNAIWFFCAEKNNVQEKKEKATESQQRCKNAHKLICHSFPSYREKSLCILSEVPLNKKKSQRKSGRAAVCHGSGKLFYIMWQVMRVLLFVLVWCLAVYTLAALEPRLRASLASSSESRSIDRCLYEKPSVQNFFFM